MTSKTTTPGLPGLNKETWRYFGVVLHFRDNVQGGIPLDESAIDGWLGARVKAGRLTSEEAARIKTEMKLDLAERTEEDEEKVAAGGPQTCPLTVFKTMCGHPYIEPRQVRALLEDAARVLGWTKVHGFKHGVKEGTGVYPFPEEAKAGDHRTLIFLMDKHNAAPYSPDDLQLADHNDVSIERRIIHVGTPQGPRSAWKWNDTILTPTIRFVLRTAYSELSLEAVKKLMSVAEETGLGSDRATGYGKFTVVSVEEFDAGKGAKMVADALLGPRGGG